MHVATVKTRLEEVDDAVLQQTPPSATTSPMLAEQGGDWSDGRGTDTDARDEAEPAAAAPPTRRAVVLVEDTDDEIEEIPQTPDIAINHSSASSSGSAVSPTPRPANRRQSLFAMQAGGVPDVDHLRAVHIAAPAPVAITDVAAAPAALPTDAVAAPAMLVTDAVAAAPAAPATAAAPAQSEPRPLYAVGGEPRVATLAGVPDTEHLRAVHIAAPAALPADHVAAPAMLVTDDVAAAPAALATAAAPAQPEPGPLHAGGGEPARKVRKLTVRPTIRRSLRVDARRGRRTRCWMHE